MIKDYCRTPCYFSFLSLFLYCLHIIETMALLTTFRSVRETFSLSLSFAVAVQLVVLLVHGLFKHKTKVTFCKHVFLNLSFITCIYGITKTISLIVWEVPAWNFIICGSRPNTSIKYCKTPVIGDNLGEKYISPLVAVILLTTLCLENISHVWIWFQVI